MSFYSFGFEGVVDTLDYEKYLYYVIYLPAEIAAQLPLAVHPRLRFEGEMNDYSFSGAFIPSSNGHHLILDSVRLKAMGLKVGLPVELRFNIADQDGVDVPEELLSALFADKAAQQAWNALTPGKQRWLAHFVGSAKTEATREKRAQGNRTWVDGAARRQAADAGEPNSQAVNGRPEPIRPFAFKLAGRRGIFNKEACEAQGPHPRTG